MSSSSDSQHNDLYSLETTWALWWSGEVSGRELRQRLETYESIDALVRIIIDNHNVLSTGPAV